jgi:hypothetical protein
MATENKEQQRRDNDELQSWVNELYGVTISDEDLNFMYDAFKYQGFDRNNVLRELKIKCSNDVKIATELIIACALRGPKAASELKLSNGLTARSMNIPASGMKGTKGLSCSRITAATADLAAYYLKRINVPKRLPNHNCPGWLQFPSAGAILLPQNIRTQHREFAAEFSKRIKGEFNESIYETMQSNAYLNQFLSLFD